jgi:hypothetical protein
VYIPQHGVGTASLNVAVATSIVLYGFAQWAKYPEAARDGYKYVVGPRPRRTTKKGQIPTYTPEEKAAERAAARAAAAAEAATADDIVSAALNVISAAKNSPTAGTSAAPT